jgi:VIT1/CCC1 family predicted Fe2+/Mn2+ transporter
LTQDIVFRKVDAYKFLGEDGDFKVIERKNSGIQISKQLATVATGNDVKLKEIGSLGFRELDKRRRLERERLGTFMLRLRMGLFGGVALLVPIIIMALIPNLVIGLIVTSVATVLFSVVIVTYATDSSGKDVLASTAAYAAVLAVFIGTSLTNQK